MANYGSKSADAVKFLKRKLGDKTLGLSTHNLEEIEIANNLEELSYIGLGAYRNTNTKSGVRVSGGKLLEIANKSIHKVAIIGGVRVNDTFENSNQISYRVIGSDLMRRYLKHS